MNRDQNNITSEFIIRIKIGGGKNMSLGCATCCVCGEEHGLDDIKHIETKKGEIKDICKECATAISGLL